MRQPSYPGVRQSGIDDRPSLPNQNLLGRTCSTKTSFLCIGRATGEQSLCVWSTRQMSGRGYARVFALATFINALCSFPTTAATATQSDQPTPYVPASDATVLLTLGSNGAQLARTLRDRAKDNKSLSKTEAIEQVRSLLRAAKTTSDSRYVGYARALLVPWIEKGDQSVALRITHAMVLSQEHQFAAARKELAAVTSAYPRTAQAWLQYAMVTLATGDTRNAEVACREFAALQRGLLAATCVGYVQSIRGQARQGYQRIERERLRRRSADKITHAWALSVQAEIASRLGRDDLASQHYQRALALTPNDSQLREQYAELLLAMGEFDNVRSLHAVDASSDRALLQRTIAAHLSSTPHALALRSSLAARLSASRARGTPQFFAEAQVALFLDRAPHRALELALAAWEEEKTTPGIRLVAAAAKAAARPIPHTVMQWVAVNRFEDARISAGDRWAAPTTQGRNRHASES